MYIPEGDILTTITSRQEPSPEIMEVLKRADELEQKEKQLQQQVILELESISWQYAKTACKKCGISKPTEEEIEAKRQIIALFRAKKKVMPYDAKVSKKKHDCKNRMFLGDSHIRASIKNSVKYDGHEITQEEIEEKRAQILYLRSHPEGAAKALGERLRNTPEEKLAAKQRILQRMLNYSAELADYYVKSKIKSTLRIQVKITSRMIEKKRRRLMAMRERVKRDIVHKNAAYFLEDRYIINIIKGSPNYRHLNITNLLILKVRRSIKNKRAKSGKVVPMYVKQRTSNT